jgi:thymidylate synthase (FAD)
MDVSNLIKFLMLRDDSHAQYEIRVYAKLLAETLAHFFPAVNAAYEREKSRISLNVDQIEAILNRDTSNLAKGEAKVIQDIFEKLGVT